MKNMASYTKEALKDMMLAGVSDDGIGKEALNTEEILTMSFLYNRLYLKQGIEQTISFTVTVVFSFKIQRNFLGSF